MYAAGGAVKAKAPLLYSVDVGNITGQPVEKLAVVEKKMSKNQIDINVENGDLYLTFDKKFLDSVLSKAAKVHDENDQENGDGSVQGQSYMFKVNLRQESCGVEEDQFHVTYETENGEISLNLTHKFDELDHVKLAEVIIKKLNKAKALFETLK